MPELLDEFDGSIGDGKPSSAGPAGIDMAYHRLGGGVSHT